LALSTPGIGVTLECVNCFSDTLLCAEAMLALASAAPPTHGLPERRSSTSEG